MSSNNHSSDKQQRKKNRSAAAAAPSTTRPGSAGTISSPGHDLLKSSQRKGSPIMQKITALFKRNTENGHVPVRPSCFADSPERRRSESPEGAGSNRKRVASLTNKKIWKAGKSEGSKGSGVGWKPKGNLEWESDSGRQITIGDVAVNELSRVEMQALQRLAITTLQNMDIPVSHGLLRGSRNVFQRISFNTFKQRKVSVNDKIVEVSPGPMAISGVFGQPLDQVIFQDQPPVKFGCGTPVPTTPTYGAQLYLSMPSSTSPTSLTGSEASYNIVENEMNPTAMLLDALSISPSYPSPKCKRRMSLCPAEPQIPTIVTKAISYLDSKGVKAEGLFRISGAKSRINEIREKFDSGEDVELTDDMNPHDVACLLKEFFRSLPEPLMTVELFTPFLSTIKLSNLAQRRDALRLICLLLPQSNRDTLQELLEFLSRVALHSDGIILIDGTEEVGNRMTEKNLALILGPNILHKRKAQKSTDYQVQKLDAEELTNACTVMEDLIRMHLSIFVIPAQLYDACLRSLLATDSSAVDLLLKRRCYEQGLFLDESPSRGLVSRSRSTEALRKISQTSYDPSLTLEQELQEQEYIWQRTHSLSDSQRVLEEAIRGLDDLANFNHQRRYSSNDSAMGGSEAIVSPVQSESAYSEPSTLNRKRQVDSVDSAFSNNSSPTNSSEGVHHHHHHQHHHTAETEFHAPCTHIRMSSEISTASTGSPIPRQLSPEQTLDKKTASLPTLDNDDDDNGEDDDPIRDDFVDKVRSSSNTLPSHASHPHRQQQLVPQLQVRKIKTKHKVQTLPSKVTKVGTYSYQRSPILSSSNEHNYLCHSESQLDSLSCDHTPTESTLNITSSPSGYSLDSSHLHSVAGKGTVI